MMLDFHPKFSRREQRTTLYAIEAGRYATGCINQAPEQRVSIANGAMLAHTNVSESGEIWFAHLTAKMSIQGLMMLLTDPVRPGMSYKHLHVSFIHSVSR